MARPVNLSLMAFEDSLDLEEAEEKKIDWREIVSPEGARQMTPCPCCELGWEGPDEIA